MKPRVLFRSKVCRCVQPGKNLIDNVEGALTMAGHPGVLQSKASACFVTCPAQSLRICRRSPTRFSGGHCSGDGAMADPTRCCGSRLAATALDVTAPSIFSRSNAWSRAWRDAVYCPLPAGCANGHHIVVLTGQILEQAPPRRCSAPALITRAVCCGRAARHSIRPAQRACRSLPL